MKKKVALLGTGFGRIAHLPGFQASVEAEVAVVYNRDICRAQEIARDFSISTASDSISDIVQMADIDIISIALPPFMHYEVAKEAIRAGKHVLLEKPVTLDLAQAIELYHLAVKNHVVVAVNFLFRYVPYWRYLKDLVADNAVGRKRLITIEFLVQKRANDNRTWNWYSQRTLGGGALGGHGSHIFDYISWLFGSVKHLSGNLVTSIPKLPDSDGNMCSVDADDTCFLWLRLADGTPCNICISGVTYGGVGHKLTIYGDTGTLILHNPKHDDYIHGFTLKKIEPGKEEPVNLLLPCQYNFQQSFSEGRIAPFAALCNDFIKSIDNSLPMAPSLIEGVYSQLLMDLTHQSHLRNMWVEVPKLEYVLSLT